MGDLIRPQVGEFESTGDRQGTKKGCWRVGQAASGAHIAAAVKNFSGLTRKEESGMNEVHINWGVAKVRQIKYGRPVIALPITLENCGGQRRDCQGCRVDRHFRKSVLSPS